MILLYQQEPTIIVDGEKYNLSSIIKGGKIFDDEYARDIRQGIKEARRILLRYPTEEFKYNKLYTILCLSELYEIFGGNIRDLDKN